MKPRIVLATLGSLGDLHPFIALGLALHERGAGVVMACAAEYRDKVERAGLHCRPVRPSAEDVGRELGMTRAELTRALLARADFLFRKLIAPNLRVAYEDMLPIVQGADLVMTSSLCIGARLAAERCAIPWMAVVLQPFMFFSAFDPPVILNAAWLSAFLRRLGPTPTRWVLRLAKQAVAAVLHPVHALRREIGLPPTSQNPLFDGQFSSTGAIGLYSVLLGEARPDYPQPICIAGFAYFDSDAGAPAALEPPLQEFLRAGARPLVFTLGSLIVNSPGSFYRESAAAARLLGKRAVLLVGDAAAGSHDDLQAADVHVCRYAPHSLLFPRAEAVIHQGGIGTLAQGLRSGRPQLIVPFYADQRDNAVRALSLGAARTLLPRRYDAVAAAREIALLLGTPEHGRQAARLGSLLLNDDGAARAADFVLDRLR